MTTHRTGSREEWLAARLKLLDAEKELTRRSDDAFVLENGVVYHTYSAYARGLDGLWGMYQWLDRAPKGRNQTGYWLRHHDAYDKRPAGEYGS